MKQLYYYIRRLLLFLFFILTTFYQAKSQKQDSTITIIGGIKPPYEFKDENGQLVGFQVDLMKALLQKLNIPYEYKLIDWKDAIETLEKGEADMTAGLIYSPQNKHRLLYGTVLNYVYISIVSKDDGQSWNLNDLNGKKIVVINRGHASEWIKEQVDMKKTTIIPVNDFEEGLSMVERGVVDIMVGNNIITRFYIEKYKLKLKVHEMNVQPDKYCMAFKIGSEELMLKINNGLNQLKSEGIYDEIYDKWFSIYSERKIPIWIYYTIGICVLTLFLFIIILKVRIKQAVSKIRTQNNYIHLVNNKLTNVNHQLSLILENTNSGYVFLSPDKDIIWENLSMCKALGCSSIYRELNTKCYAHISNPESCTNCPVNLSIKTKHMEKTRTLSPHGRPLEITSIPIFNANGDIDGYVLKYDDITDITKAMNEAIEAKNKAEQSDQFKSAFLANMSHEIRTPLNAIVGFSNLLATGKYTATEIQEYQNIINQNSQLLLTIVNEVLDLSSIEAGYLSLHKSFFDLNILFHEIIASMHEYMPKHDVNFILNLICSECLVYLDRTRTEQIILNFLTNAIKHTEQGNITIGYSLEEGQIKIFVTDSGKGIPEEKIPFIFDRFNKLDDFKQGIGLGLSICKGITNAFGGTIGVDSVYGQGCTFWVLIPCEIRVKQ